MEEKQSYISKEELKTHNKKDDLWISISGKIYNVTDWVNHHPGGLMPLLYLAGQDATDVFLAYHPTSSSRYLNKFFTGYHLQDYNVSEISKDYRNLMSEFHKMGFFHKRGHSLFITLLITLMMFVMCVYGVLFSNSFLVHVVCSGLLGFAWVQLGWIGHDSAHYQAMLDPVSNRVMQFLAGNCLTGVSVAWWKRNHNAHHITCNALDFDPDVRLLPFFANSNKVFTSLKSQSLSRVFISNQHLTFYPVIAFYRIFMIIKCFNFVWSKKKAPNRQRELLGLVGFCVWYTLLVSCLPNWYEKATFVAISLAITGIQQFQFSLNHLSCEVYQGSLEGDDWVEKQISGSLDIACPSWMDWFHGGLQFQIEHHLFPRMPRSQLRKIAPFVKELCKKYDVPYKCASFSKANKLVFGTLRSVALEARDLSNPNPRNLVWEAMNTHG